MTKDELNEIIDWCKKKISDEKANPFNLSDKKLEGYEKAMKSVMSYLHSKKEYGTNDR